MSEKKEIIIRAKEGYNRPPKAQADSRKDRAGYNPVPVEDHDKPIITPSPPPKKEK